MEEIMKNLKYFSKTFPREALIDAVNMKSEITEKLLEELDKIVLCPEIVTENHDRMLHIYSIYLLGQFREKRGFKRVINLISLSPEDVEIIFGDVITEGLSSILYSTFDGNLSLLKSTIENPLLNIYVRGATLDVYGKLYSDGVVSKDECVEYLRELIYDKCCDLKIDIATDVQAVVIDRHIFEMIDDIQLLYDQNRIDIGMFGKYDDFIDSIYSYNHEINKVKYINDIIEEIHWWACFEKTEDEKRKTRIEMKKLEKLIAKENKLKENEIKKPRKIGRNEPCSCGSGKKYKKCCLGKKTMTKVEDIKDYLEPLEEQRKWLKYYPIQEGERCKNEIRITDIYDKESIEIDKLVYLALHHRAIPIWVKRDKCREEKIMISYLIKAYQKFTSKCKKEEITSFSEYDAKHKIHYRSKEWIEKLNNTIDKNEHKYKYEDILRSINKLNSKF